ncbi:Lcl C-terminal domain-containing protein [Roseateles albus]|uniref:DUF1566 domain-containing protein n=1 Tax=Roseateles albus TaxID=2987525 RepID=A0ABT5KCQ6_9BURK|nr:hypothetical protein [Roseateles albus]MDC8771714.1 hypothetical protein [Roseateles albus]
MHTLMMKKFLKTGAMLVVLTLAGAANATGVSGQGTWETTLLARDLDGNLANGPEAFYDTALNVTWLRNASANGMAWSAAKAWAEQDHFGLSGWRLPTTHVTTADGSCDFSATGGTSCGYNPDSSVATGSEMSHLFFQSLGNKSFYVPGTTNVQAGYGLTNTGNFRMQSADYWSSTESALYSGSAWFFGTPDGFQGYSDKSETLYALAVRSGDVAAVPEQQTWSLLLIGLTCLLLVRRWRAS